MLADVRFKPLLVLLAMHPARTAVDAATAVGAVASSPVVIASLKCVTG